MENISSSLEAINAKIEKLIHLHRSLLDQNKDLALEKQELMARVKNQEQEIKQLNENYRILKITKTLAEAAPNETNADARSKINELVREIDKCIALLNK